MSSTRATILICNSQRCYVVVRGMHACMSVCDFTLSNYKNIIVQHWDHEGNHKTVSQLNDTSAVLVHIELDPQKHLITQGWNIFSSLVG